MDNQTDKNFNKSKPRSHGCLIAFLIVLAVIIIHIAAIPVLIEIVDHIPRTKDTQTNGQYVVELQATSSTIIKRSAVLILYYPMTESPCVNPIGKSIGTKKVLSSL